MRIILKIALVLMLVSFFGIVIIKIYQSMTAQKFDLYSAIEQHDRTFGLYTNRVLESWKDGNCDLAKSNSVNAQEEIDNLKKVLSSNDISLENQPIKIYVSQEEAYFGFVNCFATYCQSHQNISTESLLLYNYGLNGPELCNSAAKNCLHNFALKLEDLNKEFSDVQKSSLAYPEIINFANPAQTSGLVNDVVDQIEKTC